MKSQCSGEGQLSLETKSVNGVIAAKCGLYFMLVCVVLEINTESTSSYWCISNQGSLLQHKGRGL